MKSRSSSHPRPGRQRELAVDELRPVRDQPPPDRIAVRVEDLEVGPVRLAREEVRRDLRLLVVGELDAVEMCGRRHPPPARVAAGPRGVEVADVDRAALHQVTATLGRVLALACADGNAATGANVAHVTRVVRPDARLLEPADVEVPHAVAELDRL
jgi:hypothetical protein